MKIRNLNSLVFTFISLVAIFATCFSNIYESHAQSAQNWSDPINLSDSGSASNPLLVIDGSGVFHVLWVDKYDGYKYVESTDGITWTPPKIVKFPFSIEDSQPVLIPDAKGFIHIFWRNNKNILYYARTAQEKFGFPSTWQSMSAIDTFVYDFDVHLGANGKLYIGYIRNPVPADDDPSGVYYRQSTDGGLSWSQQEILYESQYFRSLTPEDAHIRVGVSDGETENKVYVVWDDRSLKRIFMAKSDDAGLNWDASTAVVVPEADFGFQTPFNIEIDEFKDTILLMWQVGKLGGRCTQLSQWSADDGASWSTPTKMFDEFTTCPDESKFLPVDQSYSMALLSIQGDLSLIAWNGEAWNNPETEGGLSFMSNPVTFDTIVFRCQQVAPYKNNLFVVGCDQGTGGDIWFTSRQLNSADILFPPPSAWGIAKGVTTVSQRISSLVSVPDQGNNVHALWVQAGPSDAGSEKPRILYARLNGDKWSRPLPIISELDGLPGELSVTIDKQQRLFLSWLNKDTGDLMFSWANSDRANSPAEWNSPIVLPSPSGLNGSPNILVDASNRIVIAYAITVNEERGIYIIQSADQGETWSAPVQVFDAVSANWEMVDQPKLALTEDGKLHIIFIRYSLLGTRQPVGLYYSQSVDGGATWTTIESVSEQSVQWSEIVAYQKTLHRFWQQKDGSVISTYHQISLDSGMTWDSPAKIRQDADVISTPAVLLDWNGKIHLLQITQEDTQTLQEWEWDEGRWQLLESRKLGLQKQNYPLPLKSGITSQGIIYALLQIETVSLSDEVETSLINISRSSELTETVQPFLSSISTPSVSSLPTTTPDFQPTFVPTSPLANLEDTQSPISKNMVGLLLIAIVAFLLFILMVPKRIRTSDENKIKRLK